MCTLPSFALLWTKVLEVTFLQLLNYGPGGQWLVLSGKVWSQTDHTQQLGGLPKDLRAPRSRLQVGGLLFWVHVMKKSNQPIRL